MFSSHAKSRPTLFLLAKRFGPRGIPRPKKVKRRFSPSKRRAPAGGAKAVLEAPEKLYMNKINSSPTRAHSPNFFGPARRAVPRVETTSVEFHQNVLNQCEIVQGVLGLYNVGVADFSKTSMAALRRLEESGEAVREAVSPDILALYQVVVVEPILRYSRDMGSRNTLWIPEDFELTDLIPFLKRECIPDPTLHAIRDIAEFYNPFQKYSSNSKSAVSTRKLWEGDGSKMWDRKDPVELLKLRQELDIREKPPALVERFRTGVHHRLKSNSGFRKQYKHFAR